MIPIVSFPPVVCRLREKHGNDWSTIGAALGRSAGSVRDRCRLLKDSCRYGTWQHDEEMRLANAVYELSGAQPGEEVIFHVILTLEIGNLSLSFHLCQRLRGSN